MPEITLPDVSLQWSSGGDILKPSDAKIQQGWQVEIPPRQWFNWLDNRQDQAIAHIAQHGISVWSATLEYQANKSYVQGSDGIVYKAITTNTNINPVGGAAGNWQSAFLTADQAVQVASAAQARAMTANNVYLSPLQLANAFTGANQSLGPNGFQLLPGGLKIVWASAQTIVGSAVGSLATAVVTLPINISTIYNVQATQDLGSDLEAAEMVFSISAKTSNSVTVLFRRVAGNNTGGGASESVRANILLIGV